jgi:hypothetical protein
MKLRLKAVATYNRIGEIGRKAIIQNTIYEVNKKDSKCFRRRNGENIYSEGEK